MHTQVIHDGIDAFDRRINPGIDLLQKSDPVFAGPARITGGESFSGSWEKRSKDVSFAVMFVIDFYLGPLHCKILFSLRIHESFAQILFAGCGT